MMVEKEDLLGLSLSLTTMASPPPPPPPPPPSLLLRSSERRSGIDVNSAPVAEREMEEEEDEEEEEEAGPSSPNSALSSVSGKRSERERENEMERGSDEEDGDGSRKKLRLSKDQSAILEETFKEHSTLNPKQKVALAKQLNLRARQVEVWFQNRRARTKLKQTEVDCEFLKRCCENLTEENRRLQKEVQELRALKLSPHLYMHMTPPTTLTMCPSCERVSNSAAASAASSIPPMHFLNHRDRRLPVAPAPWAPIPIRPSFLDAPPQRS
ncbi:homeobox-leucine zipper protein HAT4-like [Typha angustifolia]|uniref:homeobox-leucine zipper protein HAT4-like n=1 Tax=Typha angustifolia TaxID=59011 RepID=UPI003C2D7DDE